MANYHQFDQSFKDYQHYQLLVELDSKWCSLLTAFE